MTTSTWTPQWTLADRLRKIRRDRHVSQEKFAEMLAVKHPTYAAWEAGRNRPDQVVELAQRVESVTGVPAAWTLGVYGAPDTSDSQTASNRGLVTSEPGYVFEENVVGDPYWAVEQPAAALLAA